MSRHVGDLVLIPEAKPDEGLIVWWLGVLAREGGRTRADGGSYVRLGEKRKRKIEPGGVGQGGIPGLRPYVAASVLEDGWQDRLPATLVTVLLDPFLVLEPMYAILRPHLKEGHPLAA